MIGTQMKKVAGAATPTTRNENPRLSYVQNLTEILASTLLILALLLAFAAWGFAELEPLKAIILAVSALLLLAVRDGVVRVDREWHKRMAAWRDLHSRELDGEQVGRFYVGDGTPRTESGSPYEPLEWGKVRRA